MIQSILLTLCLFLSFSAQAGELENLFNRAQDPRRLELNAPISQWLDSHLPAALEQNVQVMKKEFSYASNGFEGQYIVTTFFKTHNSGQQLSICKNVVNISIREDKSVNGPTPSYTIHAKQLITPALVECSPL